MKNFLEKFNSNKEIILVGLVILVLLMMVVPLSPFMMDFIIAINISITVLVLMVVIYMRTLLALTSFPSILLFLALIRIGITVSTSRLILLTGNAGEIVTTFGEFVVGGNLIVGIIIFIIITIINFIVITKGSERVAEVAARFSLDAMPGSQMSIDSDLKAGNITMEEATIKRKNLGLESKLYGAMDGAMKFVKGDAIASIIDILINLVGGLLIGILQNDMDFSHALSTYSILTVGDGLVQQIPALIISLTAGMMITRVGDDSENENLGQNVLRQIFQNYKAMFAASGLILIMSTIPGMPSSVFLMIFTLLSIFAFSLYRKSLKVSSGVRNDAVIEDSGDESVSDNSKSNVDGINMHIIPLILYLAPSFKASNDMKKLKDILADIQQSIANELGVLIPPIIIRYNEKLKHNDFQLAVFEIPVSSGIIYWDSILLLDTQPHHLQLLDMRESTVNLIEFGGKELGVWINDSNLKICSENNLRYLSCNNFLLLHLKLQIQKHVSDFLGMQEVKNILDKMTAYQDLIKELVRMLPLNKITEIFQRLVAENVSIRNFKVILDALLEWSQREKETYIITEYVRQSLGRYIAYKFSNGKYIFASIIFSIDIENTIRDSIRYANEGSYLAIDPEITENICEQINQILQTNPDAINMIILVHMDIRRYVRSFTEKRFSFLPVLSYQELEGHAEFNGIGVININ